MALYNSTLKPLPLLYDPGWTATPRNHRSPPRPTTTKPTKRARRPLHLRDPSANPSDLPGTPLSSANADGFMLVSRHQRSLSLSLPIRPLVCQFRRIVDPVDLWSLWGGINADDVDEREVREDLGRKLAKSLEMCVSEKLARRGGTGLEEVFSGWRWRLDGVKRREEEGHGDYKVGIWEDVVGNLGERHKGLESCIGRFCFGCMGLIGR